MNELITYEYKGSPVRTTRINDELWWVLKDVCSILGLTNNRMVYDRLETDEKGVSQIDTPGGTQSVQIINEPGLYNVILRSDKPEAKAFKHWVTHEILPSIRKHGAYLTPETLEAAILNPDMMIKLCTALKDEQDRRKALEAANASLQVDKEIMRPKAEYFDELVDRNLLTNFRETAKQLNVPPKKFVSFLIDSKYIYRDRRGKLMPYQPHVDSGLFQIKECVNDKTQWSGTQTLVTPKGRETFRLLYLQSA